MQKATDDQQPPTKGGFYKRLKESKMKDKAYDATAQGQKDMFYKAGRQATLNMLSDYIDKRSKERFQMVKAWHTNGKKDEEWAKIEEFDRETDKQEKIYEDMMK